MGVPQCYHTSAHHISSSRSIKGRREKREKAQSPPSPQKCTKSSRVQQRFVCVCMCMVGVLHCPNCLASFHSTSPQPTPPHIPTPPLFVTATAAGACVARAGRRSAQLPLPQRRQATRRGSVRAERLWRCKWVCVWCTCVVLCCVVLCCVVLCCAVLCCVVLSCLVLCCVVLSCPCVRSRFWCSRIVTDTVSVPPLAFVSACVHSVAALPTPLPPATSRVPTAGKRKGAPWRALTSCCCGWTRSLHTSRPCRAKSQSHSKRNPPSPCSQWVRACVCVLCVCVCVCLVCVFCVCVCFACVHCVCVCIVTTIAFLSLSPTPLLSTPFLCGLDGFKLGKSKKVCMHCNVEPAFLASLCLQSKG